MKQTLMNILPRALICGFVLTFLFGFFPFASACDSLSEEIIRLHVVANSDSEEDQQVKLKVRDAVLREAAGWYGDAANLEEANFQLCTHLDAITEAANRTLQENGFPQRVKVQVTDMYFTTRQYEEFSLPAGKYRTLRVTIGAGEGKNWWCIVFPSLCLPAAQPQDGLGLLPENQKDIMEHAGEYQVKFKALELYEGLKAWFDKE